MYVRAKCMNTYCASYGLEKSFAIGIWNSFGATDEHVICRSCGLLMMMTRPGPARNTSDDANATGEHEDSHSPVQLNSKLRCNKKTRLH
jgi:hypothetical protein